MPVIGEPASAPARGPESSSGPSRSAARPPSNRTPPKRLTVTAAATFDRVGEGWKVTAIELAVKGEVPGIDGAKFAEIAADAKNNCPISQALKNNVAVTLKAELTTASSSGRFRPST